MPNYFLTPGTLGSLRQIGRLDTRQKPIDPRTGEPDTYDPLSEIDAILGPRRGRTPPPPPPSRTRLGQAPPVEDEPEAEPPTRLNPYARIDALLNEPDDAPFAPPAGPKPPVAPVPPPQPYRRLLGRPEGRDVHLPADRNLPVERPIPSLLKGHQAPGQTATMPDIQVGPAATMESLRRAKMPPPSGPRVPGPPVDPFDMPPPSRPAEPVVAGSSSTAVAPGQPAERRGGRFGDFAREGALEGPSRPRDHVIKLLEGTLGIGEAAVGLADIVLANSKVGTPARALGLSVGGLAAKAGFHPEAWKAVLNSFYSKAHQDIEAGAQEAANTAELSGPDSARVKDLVQAGATPADAFAEVRATPAWASRANKVLAIAGYAITHPSRITESIAESLPGMVAGARVGMVAERALVGAAAKVPGLIGGAVGEGGVQAGQMAEQVRQEQGGKPISVEQAQLALASGVGDSLIGYFSGTLAAKYGIVDVDTMLAAGAVNPKAGRRIAQQARQFLGSMAQEGLFEEGLQTIQETVLQNKAQHKRWDTGIEDATIMGILTGAAQAGGTNAATILADRLAGEPGARSPEPRAPITPDAPAAVPHGAAPTPHLPQQMLAELRGRGFTERDIADLSLDQATGLLDADVRKNPKPAAPPIPENFGPDVYAGDERRSATAGETPGGLERRVKADAPIDWTNPKAAFVQMLDENPNIVQQGVEMGQRGRASRKEAPPRHAPETYDYSSTQVDLPPEDAKAVRDLAATIPNEALAGKGREDAPHATVLYGLHTEDAEDVRKILAGEQPITVTLGKTSTFPPSESSDGATVLKVDLDSPDLHRLNAKLAKALEHTNSFGGDYKPHITIAYLQAEAAKQYSGLEILAGRQITLHEIAFKGKDGKTVTIPLGGKPGVSQKEPEVSGKDSETPYTATFAYDEPSYDNPDNPRDPGTMVPKYQLHGGPEGGEDRSHVTAERLKELGLAIPEKTAPLAKPDGSVAPRPPASRPATSQPVSPDTTATDVLAAVQQSRNLPPGPIGDQLLRDGLVKKHQDGWYDVTEAGKVFLRKTAAPAAPEKPWAEMSKAERHAAFMAELAAEAKGEKVSKPQQASAVSKASESSEKTAAAQSKKIAELPDGDKPGYARVPFPVGDDATLAKLPLQVDYSHPQIERVPIADLIATQGTITRDVATQKLARGPKDITEIPAGANTRPPSDLPVVITGPDGKRYLAGGTHEATAAWARGDKDLQVIAYPSKEVAKTARKALPGPPNAGRYERKSDAGYTPEAKTARRSFQVRLAKLQTAKDWQGLIDLNDEFETWHDTHDVPMPDDWSKWQRAADDAKFALQRAEKPVIGKPLAPPASRPAASQPAAGDLTTQAITVLEQAVDAKDSLKDEQIHTITDKTRQGSIDRLRDGTYVMDAMKTLQPGVYSITYRHKDGEKKSFTNFLRTAEGEWPAVKPKKDKEAEKQRARTARDDAYDANRATSDAYYASLLTDDVERALTEGDPTALAKEYSRADISRLREANYAKARAKGKIHGDPRFERIHDALHEIGTALREAEHAAERVLPRPPTVIKEEKGYGQTYKNNVTLTPYTVPADSGVNGKAKKAWTLEDGTEWILDASHWHRVVPASEFKGPTSAFAEYYRSLSQSHKGSLAHDDTVHTLAEMLEVDERAFAIDAYRGRPPAGTTIAVGGKPYVFTGERAHMEDDDTAKVPASRPAASQPAKSAEQFDAAVRGITYDQMTEKELRELLDIGVGDEPSKAATEMQRRQAATGEQDDDERETAEEHDARRQREDAEERALWREEAPPLPDGQRFDSKGYAERYHNTKKLEESIADLKEQSKKKNLNKKDQATLDRLKENLKTEKAEAVFTFRLDNLLVSDDLGWLKGESNLQALSERDLYRLEHAGQARARLEGQAIASAAFTDDRLDAIEDEESRRAKAEPDIVIDRQTDVDRPTKRKNTAANAKVELIEHDGKLYVRDPHGYGMYPGGNERNSYFANAYRVVPREDYTGWIAPRPYQEYDDALNKWLPWEFGGDRDYAGLATLSDDDLADLIDRDIIKEVSRGDGHGVIVKVDGKDYIRTGERAHLKEWTVAPEFINGVRQKAAPASKPATSQPAAASETSETFTTPGTKVTWRTGQEWADGFRTINKRPISGPRYEREEAHFKKLAQMPAFVAAQGREDLEAIKQLLRDQKHNSHVVPVKGRRQGSSYETIINEVNNALQRLGSKDTAAPASKPNGPIVIPGLSEVAISMGAAADQFEPGDQVTYEGKPYTVLGRAGDHLRIKPTGQSGVNERQVDARKIPERTAPADIVKKQQSVEKNPQTVAYSQAAIADAMNLTPEQAEATHALIDAMGIDTADITIAKGGTPGEGALSQDPPQPTGRVAKFPTREDAQQMTESALLDAMLDTSQPDVARRYIAEELETRGIDAALWLRQQGLRGHLVPPMPKGSKSTHGAPAAPMKVVFAYVWPDFHADGSGQKMYRVTGGIYGQDGTDLGADSVRALGLEVPPDGPTDPTILLQAPLYQGPKGAVEFAEDGKAIIRGLAGADVSTAVHEFFHVFRRQFLNRNVPLAQRHGITDDDIDVAEAWAGAEDGWTVAAEENFANGAERYLYDGTAPSPILAKLFAQFSEWLKRIYKTLKGSTLDIEISPAMRELYGKILQREYLLRAGGKSWDDSEAFTAYQFAVNDDEPALTQIDGLLALVGQHPSYLRDDGIETKQLQRHARDIEDAQETIAAADTDRKREDLDDDLGREDASEILDQADRLIARELRRREGQGDLFQRPRTAPASRPAVSSPITPITPLTAPTADRAPIVFRSGNTRAPADLAGFIQANQPIGITVGAAYPVRARAAEYARNGGQVFLDSGAFGQADPDFKAVFKDYNEFLDHVQTDKLGGNPKHLGNVYLVAPDKVGDSKVTRALQDEYYGDISTLFERGANVIVPVQVRDTMAGDIAHVVRTFPKALVGLPANKYPVSDEQLDNIVRQLTYEHLTPAGFHFLGMGEKNVNFEKRVGILRKAFPHAVITADSNRTRAMMAEGRPAHTEAKELADLRADNLVDNAWEGDTTELAGSFFRGEFDTFAGPELAQLAQALNIAPSKLVARGGNGEAVQKAVDQSGLEDALMLAIGQIAKARMVKRAAPGSRTDAIAKHDAKPEAKERAALIERIVAAARKPVPTIVESVEMKGSDGKWYHNAFFPTGVKSANERRVVGYVYHSGSATYGNRFDTREAAAAAWNARQDRSDADFRRQLAAHSSNDERLQSAAAYWLKDKAPGEAIAVGEKIQTVVGSTWAVTAIGHNQITLAKERAPRNEKPMVVTVAKYLEMRAYSRTITDQAAQPASKPAESQPQSAEAWRAQLEAMTDENLALMAKSTRMPAVAKLAGEILADRKTPKPKEITAGEAENLRKRLAYLTRERDSAAERYHKLLMDKATETTRKRPLELLHALERDIVELTAKLTAAGAMPEGGPTKPLSTLKIGDRVDSWQGKGTIRSLTDDNVQIYLEDQGEQLSKWMARKDIKLLGPKPAPTRKPYKAPKPLAPGTKVLVANENAPVNRSWQRSATEAERAVIFQPGNIVEAYGGVPDRVIAYTPTSEAGLWRVTVQHADGKEGPRAHATQPDVIKDEFRDRVKAEWIRTYTAPAVATVAPPASKPATSQSSQKPAAGSWKAEITDGSSWASNALRFATEAEAKGSGGRTFDRWMAAKDMRVAQSDDPVTHRFVDGENVRLEDAAPVPAAAAAAEETPASKRAKLIADAKARKAKKDPDVLYQEPPTDAAFKAWFRESAVTDSAGRPLRAFHGTTADFTVFDTHRPSKTKNADGHWAGDFGSWFTAPSLYALNYDDENAEFMASDFAGDNYRPGANVMPVYLSIQRPREFEGYDDFDGERGMMTGAEFRDALQADGYDGAVIRNSDTDGHVDRDDWIAFEPEQIKSATGNRGTYDRTDPNILYQDPKYDADDISTLLDIIETYKDEGITDFGTAVRQFQADWGEGARHLDRPFELAWKRWFGDAHAVADHLTAPELDAAAAEARLQALKDEYGYLHATGDERRVRDASTPAARTKVLDDIEAKWKAERAERDAKDEASDREEQQRLEAMRVEDLALARALQPKGTLVWRTVTRKRQLYWRPIAGKTGVRVPGAPADLTFSAYKDPDSRNWQVIEDTTGQAVGTAGTMVAAIADATDKLSTHDAARIAEVITKQRALTPENPHLTDLAPAGDTTRTDDAAAALHLRIFDYLKDLTLRQVPKNPVVLRKEIAQQLDVPMKALEDDIDALNDAVEAKWATTLRSMLAGTIGPSLTERVDAARDVESQLPRGHRTLEKSALQQFSTPLPISVIAAAATQADASDVVLEPTAGTGNLLAGVPRAATILALELSPRRADLLRTSGYTVTAGDYLSHHVSAPQPTVILTNPPWGKYSTGRYGRGVALGFAPSDVAERFVGKNLRDLAEGGRLVAVMPTTMLEATSFKKWLRDNYTVRAIIKSPAGSYDTRATTIESILLVVDKIGASGSLPAVFDATDWEAYIGAVEALDARRATTEGRAPDAPRPDSGVAAGGVRGGSGGGPAGGRRDTAVGAGRAPKLVAGGPNDGGRAPVDPEGTPDGPAAEPQGKPADVPAPAPELRAAAAASGYFAPYTRRSAIRGQPHPKLLVEARQLAGVPYPPLTATLTPAMQRAVTAGRVSVEQAEQALAALQANSGDKPFGYLAADAVGVGKSREIAMTILGAMDRAQTEGRPLRLMLTTKSRDNVEDLLDEIHYVASGQTAAQGGSVPFEIYRLADDYPGAKKSGNAYEPLPKTIPHAVYVVDSFNVAVYRQALVDVDLHGIVGDEVQRFTNAEANIGAAWINLHARVMRGTPRAEQFFAYFTATPAQKVEDYRYLYGLRLWPIDGFSEWLDLVTGGMNEEQARKLAADTERGSIKDIDAVVKATGADPVGGDADGPGANKPSRSWGVAGPSVFSQQLTPAEAEQIPREWKMLGRFSARDLWRAGTTFEIHKFELTDQQQKTYDAFVDLAVDIATMAHRYGLYDKSGKASRFGVTGMLQFAAKRIQMQPALDEAIRLAKQFAAEGYQPVFSIINVSEMSAERGHLIASIDKINTRMIDADPNDPDGGVVDLGEIPEAVIDRARLMDRVRDLGSFADPIDTIADALGRDKVAFIIGKEKASRRKGSAEFQSGARPFAVISGAGSTGINLDQRARTALGPAHGKRVFLDVQYEWSAMEGVQRYGRVDRASSIEPPRLIALTSGNAAEKKFLATIANRMAALGALSKGGAESTGAAGHALEEFEITGDDALSAARRAYEESDDATKRSFATIKSAFRDPNRNGSNPDHGDFDPFAPRRDAHGVGMIDFQLPLLLMPMAQANAFWDKFIQYRDELRAESGEQETMRATRFKGEVLTTTPLKENLTLYTVQNEEKKRFGILVGLITPEMPRLRTLLRGAQHGDVAEADYTATADVSARRRYVTFTTHDTILAGLQIPFTRIARLAESYGASAQRDELKTAAQALAYLKAGETIALAVKNPDSGKPWTLRFRRSDERIVIDNTRMVDRTLLLAHGAGYSPVGNYWHVTDLAKFLERWPIPDQGEAAAPPAKKGGTPPASSGGRSSGFEVQSTLIPGAKAFVDQDVTPALKAAGEGVQRARTEIRTLFAPDTMGTDAAVFAGSMRANLAAFAQKSQRARKVLKDAFNAFEPLKARADQEDPAAIAEFLAFTDVMDGIAKPETLPPELQALATQMRDMNKLRLRKIQQLGRLRERSGENYFGRIWKTDTDGNLYLRGPAGAAPGRRPLQGRGKFLRPRTWQTMREGVELGATPETWNPVEMFLLKLAEQDKWIMGRSVLMEGKSLGVAKFVRAGAKDQVIPDGWRKYHESFGTVYGPPVVQVKEAYDKKLMDGLFAVASALGVRHVRKVAVGGRRWGYAVGASEITTKIGGPEGVLMHELGHILDERYGLRQQWVNDKKFKQELRDLADLRFEGLQQPSPGRMRYYRKGEEKIANLLHAFLYVPEKAEDVAPKAYRALRTLIGKHAELRPLIDLQQNGRSLTLGVNVGEQSAGGLVIRGYYYGPPDAVRILDNYLSPGLRGRNLAFDLYRQTGNVMNQVQLGMSGFHLAMTGIEAVVGKMAQGFVELSRGEIGDAAKSFAEVPVATITTLIKGDRVLKQLYAKDANALLIADTIDQIIQGGGGIHRDESFKAYDGRVENLLRALRQGNVLGAALRVPGALFEIPTKFIMEWWVPRLKLGAYMDLAAMELRTLGPEPTLTETRRVLGRVQDTIDDRFGQLIYDNLFWNNTLKQLGQGMFRSLGWNTGTVRTVFGAPFGQAAQTASLLTGKPVGGYRPVRMKHTGYDVNGARIFEPQTEPWLTHKGAYVMSLVFTVGLMGTLFQLMHAGEPPKELKDLFFPRTGKKRLDGSDERVSFPSYLKDIYSVWQHPLATVGHKLQPALDYFYEVFITNEDFFGTEVRNPQDPAIEQAKDLWAHLVDTMLPFTVQSFVQRKRDKGESGVSGVESFLGVTPAPASIYRTKAQALMQSYMPPLHRTREEAAEARTRGSLRDAIRRGNTEERVAIMQGGTLTARQVTAAEKAARLSPLEGSFKHLTAEQALAVYDVATLEERAVLRPMLQQKSNLIQNATPKEQPELWRQYRAAYALPVAARKP